MNDGIIKGDGNSRYLKTVQDAMTRYPTFEAFMQALAEGTFPIDLNGYNPEGWKQLGTPTDKANLLSDETAEAITNICGATPGTPNEAFVGLTRMLPTGSVLWRANQTAPVGFLLCDGSQVSRTLYASLYSVIGTTFGVGDDETTFNIPDLRAKFIRGAGASGGYTGTFGQTQEATAMDFTYGTAIHDYSKEEITSLWAERASPFANYDKRARKSSGSSSRNAENLTLNQSYNIDLYNHYFRPYNITLTPIIKY